MAKTSLSSNSSASRSLDPQYPLPSFPHSVYSKFRLCGCFRELALATAGKANVGGAARQGTSRQARSLWVTEDRLHEFI